MLLKTSFLSINEIDLKAAENNVKINDNNSHKFRTCYNDYTRNEINYYYFVFGKQSKPGGIIGEIFAIRIYRAFQEFKKAQIDFYRISKNHVMDAMIRYLINLGMYFSISMESLIEYFNVPLAS